MSLIAPTLEAFFTERLIAQRNASPQTIASYRDSLRVLLAFAHTQTGKHPSELDLADLDAPLIGAFLTHLEHERGNSVSTRNARLVAIHSLYRYAALRHPEHAATIARVLAMPSKRHDRSTVSYLTSDEIQALLQAPDRTTWLGRRDRALLQLAIQTGLRLSELTTLRLSDAVLTTPGAHVRCRGKSRKERTPLTSETLTVLRDWLNERQGEPTDPLFPTRRGTQLSRDAVELLVAKHAGPCSCHLRLAHRQTRHPARPQTHQRDAPPRSQRRHRNHRALARPREHQNHPHLPTRRPRTLRTSSRTHRTARHPTR